MSARKRPRPGDDGACAPTRRTEPLRFISCPICSVRFPAAFLDAHVNSCLDSQAVRAPSSTPPPQLPWSQPQHHPQPLASSGTRATLRPPAKRALLAKEEVVSIDIHDSPRPQQHADAPVEMLPPAKKEGLPAQHPVVTINIPDSPQRERSTDDNPGPIRQMLQKIRLLKYWPNFLMAGMADAPIDPTWGIPMLRDKLGIRTIGAQKRILAELDGLFPARLTAQSVLKSEQHHTTPAETELLPGRDPLSTGNRAPPAQTHPAKPVLCPPDKHEPLFGPWRFGFAAEKQSPSPARPLRKPPPPPSSQSSPLTKSDKKPAASGSWRFGPRKNPRPHAKCKLVHGTTFTVDSFAAAPGRCKEFFLSHFHSDHYGGLYKAWDAGIILCSAITARLVVSQLGVDQSLVRVLDMGIPQPIEDTGSPSSQGNKKAGATVTLIDANHCPGAVIFLFTSWEDGKRSVHCGDCRYNPDTIGQNPILLEYSSSLDFLHLDTTYCNQRYNFPRQSVVIEAAVQAACSEAKRGEGHTLFCVGSYTIGKERIYMAVAEALDLKVFADARKRRILGSLDLPAKFLNRLVSKRAEASLLVVAMREVNHEAMENLLRKAPGKFTRCVGFKPTGWTWRGGGSGMKQQTLDGGVKPTGVERKVGPGGKTVVYGVAYSEHSSFEELRALVALCKARKVIPTVGGSRPEELARMLEALQVSEAR